MRNRVDGKRVAIGALVAGLTAMLAVGVALGVGQRDDGPPATWLSGVIGDGSHGTIKEGQPLGPGRYEVPFENWAHAFPEDQRDDLVGKALVFTVPVGLRLNARVRVCWAEPCLGPYLELEGEDVWFDLWLETAEEADRRYPFNTSRGEPTDDYGYPLRCGGREGCQANDDRPAKYDPLIDRVVASAHIASAR